MACSGGSDSLALLYLMAEGPWPLHAAHLDHGGREDSAAQAQRVREHCEHLGVTFWQRRLHVHSWAHRYGLSWEAAAREVRYRWLRRLAAQLGARVLTAHTQEDQAETLLLRILQGTTLGGLAGIEPTRAWLERPLLRSHRSELQSYLRTLGVSWFEDPGNHDRRFLRSRVRHELLPVLLDLNPGAVAHLAALADDALELRAVFTRNPDLGRLAFEEWLHGRWIAQAPRPGARWSREHARRIYASVEAGQPGLWHLPGGVGAEFCPPCLYLGPLDVPLPPLLTEPDRRREPASPCSVVLKPEAAERVQWRFWQPGDRLGTRSLKKCWNDWKVPRSLRRRLPLLAREEEVLWVPGYATDPHSEWVAEEPGGVRFSFSQERSAWQGVEAPRRDVSAVPD